MLQQSYIIKIDRVGVINFKAPCRIKSKIWKINIGKIAVIPLL